jgi:hypothetical protein
MFNTTKVPVAIFTTLYFLRNLQMGPIGYSVLIMQAYLANLMFVTKARAHPGEVTLKVL